MRLACSLLLCRGRRLHHFLCRLLLCVSDGVVSEAGKQLSDGVSERGVKVEEDERVEAEVEHAQQQSGLLPQKQPLLSFTVGDEFGLGQRVRRADHVVGDEAEYIGQRHSRHACRHPPGIRPEFGVAAAAQELFDSQGAGDERGGGGVEEERRAKEDRESVPVKADVLLQRRAAEVGLLLQEQQKHTSLRHSVTSFCSEDKTSPIAAAGLHGAL